MSPTLIEMYEGYYTLSKQEFVMHYPEYQYDTIKFLSSKFDELEAYMGLSANKKALACNTNRQLYTRHLEAHNYVKAKLG